MSTQIKGFVPSGMRLAFAMLPILNIEKRFSPELILKGINQCLFARFGLRLSFARQDVEVEVSLAQAFQPWKHFSIYMLLETLVSEAFADIKDMGMLIRILECKRLTDGEDI